MIKVTELRIGNFVEFHYPEEDSGGNMVGQSDIRQVRDGKDIDHVGEWPDAYEPIPISPGVLGKCGFENNADAFGEFDSCHEDQEGNRIDCHKGVYKWWLVDRYSRFIEVKYLHQLQNLFLAISGEELNVRL